MICWNLRPGKAHISSCPPQVARLRSPSLRFPRLLQFPLLIEVKDPILEVVHLAEDQGFVKDITEATTLQEGDGLCVKLLFDLKEEGRAAGHQGKMTRPLRTRQVNYLFLSVQFPLHGGPFSPQG